MKEQQEKYAWRSKRRNEIQGARARINVKEQQEE
jgi:hypothetical protein